MSDEELKAELERLRQENTALNGFWYADESQRERRGLGLRYGSIPGHFIQRAMAQTAGHGRRHSCVHCCQRGAPQNQERPIGRSTALIFCGFAE